MSEWISVGDDMPDDLVDVLVSTSFGVTAAFFDGGWESLRGTKLRAVSHWMHFPETPCESSGKTRTSTEADPSPEKQQGHYFSEADLYVIQGMVLNRLKENLQAIVKLDEEGLVLSRLKERLMLEKLAEKLEPLDTKDSG